MTFALGVTAGALRTSMSWSATPLSSWPSCGVAPRLRRTDPSFAFLNGTTRSSLLRRENWIESGQILGKIHSDRGFEATKLRDLHFDVLIALTARTQGARVITSNRTDFELICEYREFKLEVW